MNSMTSLDLPKLSLHALILYTLFITATPAIHATVLQPVWPDLFELFLNCLSSVCHLSEWHAHQALDRIWHALNNSSCWVLCVNYVAPALKCHFHWLVGTTVDQSIMRILRYIGIFICQIGKEVLQYSYFSQTCSNVAMNSNRFGKNTHSAQYNYKPLFKACQNRSCAWFAYH